MQENKMNDFKIERYKYILQEIHTLNGNIDKYLTLFQTLTTLLIGGGISIFISWKNLHINVDIAKAAVQGILILLIIFALFLIISILAGVFSWYDYRKEEVELLNEVVGRDFRKLPNLKNFWRWHETYIILFVSVVVVAIYLYAEYQIIPLIK